MEKIIPVEVNNCKREPGPTAVHRSRVVPVRRRAPRYTYRRGFAGFSEMCEYIRACYTY